MQIIYHMFFIKYILVDISYFHVIKKKSIEIQSLKIKYNVTVLHHIICYKLFMLAPPIKTRRFFIPFMLRWVQVGMKMGGVMSTMHARFVGEVPWVGLWDGCGYVKVHVTSTKRARHIGAAPRESRAGTQVLDP